MRMNPKSIIHKSLITGENKAFVQFPAHYIEDLPCKIEDALIDKSEKLLQLRTEDESIEKEIDNMVYDLYGLTEEEIKIVEGGAG